MEREKRKIENKLQNIQEDIDKYKRESEMVRQERDNKMNFIRDKKICEYMFFLEKKINTLN